MEKELPRSFSLGKQGRTNKIFTLIVSLGIYYQWNAKSPRKLLPSSRRYLCLKLQTWFLLFGLSNLYHTIIYPLPAVPVNKRLDLWLTPTRCTGNNPWIYDNCAVVLYLLLCTCTLRYGYHSKINNKFPQVKNGSFQRITATLCDDGAFKQPSLITFCTVIAICKFLSSNSVLWGCIFSIKEDILLRFEFSCEMMPKTQHFSSH